VHNCAGDIVDERFSERTRDIHFVRGTAPCRTSGCGARIIAPSTPGQVQNTPPRESGRADGGVTRTRMGKIEEVPRTTASPWRSSGM
jgi:hypothetical protein